MDLAKSYEVFQPEKVTDRIHIIGCGAGGSTIAELLARYGLTQITLYDDDVVDSHNIANQMYRYGDIGKPKVEALASIICEINPDAHEDLRLVNERYVDQRLSGYVFLCVDRIETRKEIVMRHRNNTNIKAMFEFRNRLYDAQHRAADWSRPEQIADLLKSMQFSHEDAMRDTPVNACNLPLSVAPTLRLISSYGVANFTNFVTGKGLKTFLQIHPNSDESGFGFEVETY